MDSREEAAALAVAPLGSEDVCGVPVAAETVGDRLSGVDGGLEAAVEDISGTSQGAFRICLRSSNS